MRILVTGASGFAGRAVTAALAGPERKVRAAARHPGAIASSAYVEPVYLPDLASDIDWTPLLQEIDVVVHLAGIAHAGTDIAERQYDQVNHRATARLAQSCAAQNIRLIFISSIRAQTGPVATHVLTETDAAAPSDAYGRSKLNAEGAIRRCASSATILRPVVIYGPDVKGNIASLMRLADTPLPLPFGRFDNERSLLALDNLVAAIEHTIKTETTKGQIYIVADNTPISLAGMIAVMREGLARPPRLLAVPPAFFEASLRAIGRTGLWERIGGSLIADAKALRASGWQPRVNTRAGLIAMVQAASPLKSGTASRSTP